MPWTDYSPDVRQFSGLVQAAAEARFGAAATSEVVAAAARSAGIRLGFSSFTDIARLYGSYVGVRTSREALGAAAEVSSRTGIPQGITGQMIASAPYSPDDRMWSMNPYVWVKGEYTIQTPEGPITGILSHRYRIDEIHTVDQVLAELQAVIDSGLAGDYLQTGTVTGITSIERANP